MEEMEMKIHVHKSTREIKTVSGKEYITSYSVLSTDFDEVKLSHSLRTKKESPSDIEVFKEIIGTDNDDFFIREYDFTIPFTTISRAATPEEIKYFESHLQNQEPPKSLIKRIGNVLGVMLAVAALTVLTLNLVFSIINLLN